LGCLLCVVRQRKSQQSYACQQGEEFTFHEVKV
jgi:hypothetical protein